MKKKLLLLMLAITFYGWSATPQIYVSPQGNDKNPGTKEKPLASFEKAQELARCFDKTKPLNVIFNEGIYYLPKPIVFTEKDSREKNAIVTYRAAKEGTAILSGGCKLNLLWKPYPRIKGAYVATVKEDITIDQLYINGARQRMARFPNAVEGKNVFDAWNLNKGSGYDNHGAMNTLDINEDPINPKRINTWKSPTGGYLHAMHNSLWGDMHWEITGKKNDTTLTMIGGWQNNRPAPMHNRFRMIENVFEELDTPGEWFFNHQDKQLYYIPAANVAIDKATVEVVRLANLINFQGSEQKPVSNVNLDGFIFKHVARSFMENREPLGRSDWTVYRGGAVSYNGAVSCTLANSEFDQVGGNTVFVNNYNRQIKITGCYIHNSGANGIAFVGDTSAVRSYLVGYVNQNYTTLDTIPGPANNNYPADCVVDNCIITRTGRDEKQTAGVQISMAAHITIIHCSIYDVPRAGINISEGCFGGHTIDGCDIFNTVLETGDHGSFNSWGRDRYWTPDVNVVAKEVAKHPEMTHWDMLAPNTIQNSRWRCDYGWDIDLDDGSSNYIIRNNLLLNRGIKLREGYNRLVENNIVINNSLHNHIWFPNSGDIVRRNIFFTAYKPVIMNTAIAEDGKWGKEIDYNLFACDNTQRTKYAKNGCDAHSVCGDPMFVNPTIGNFTVKEDSPALALGFKNFDMTHFGVQKASLKAIAKQPIMPNVVIKLDEKTMSEVYKPRFYWYGAELIEPKGDELSAFGSNYDEGGVAIFRLSDEIKEALPSLREGMLIQQINGVNITSIADLSAYLQNHENSTSHTVTYMQTQKRQELKLSGKLKQISKK